MAIQVQVAVVVVVPAEEAPTIRLGRMAAQEGTEQIMALAAVLAVAPMMVIQAELAAMARQALLSSRTRR